MTAGSQKSRNVARKLWRTVPEVCLYAIGISAAAEAVASVVQSQAGLNPTSTLSHYPSGIPPSLAEAQPCAGVFLSLCLCAAGAAHQERFRHARSTRVYEYLRVSTSDAPKSVIAQYSCVWDVYHCRCCCRCCAYRCCVRPSCQKPQFRTTDALNAKASARPPRYAALR